MWSPAENHKAPIRSVVAIFPVENGVTGILLVADRYNESGPVNLGSAFEIKDLAERIARLSGTRPVDVVLSASKQWNSARRTLLPFPGQVDGIRIFLVKTGEHQ